MKPGDKVMMVDCREARDEPGRIWTVASEPWELGHGQWVVKLEGKRGGFSMKCLRKVEETTA